MDAVGGRAPRLLGPTAQGGWGIHNPDPENWNGIGSQGHTRSRVTQSADCKLLSTVRSGIRASDPLGDRRLLHLITSGHMYAHIYVHKVKIFTLFFDRHLEKQSSTASQRRGNAPLPKTSAFR